MREVKDDGRESDCRWTSDNSAFKRSSRMTPRTEWYRGQSTWDAEKDNGVVDERRLSLCWILKKLCFRYIAHFQRIKCKDCRCWLEDVNMLERISGG